MHSLFNEYSGVDVHFLLCFSGFYNERRKKISLIQVDAVHAIRHLGFFFPLMLLFMTHKDTPLYQI